MLLALLFAAAPGAAAAGQSAAAAAGQSAAAAAGQSASGPASAAGQSAAAAAGQSASGLAASRAAAPGAATPGPLANAGRWLVDPSGRVVVLHGLNMVYKLPPYQPGAVGFGRDDAGFLRRYGFNTVRLGLIYKAVEPQPGRYDSGYITKVRTLERMLARRGVYSLVDFHQDLYNEKFTGEGWPDWAVLDDGLPAEPLTGFPGTYITSPGMNRAFDNFWSDATGPGGVRLQERYAAAWARVAKSFGGDSGVLGYDILNEPWPGSGFAACLNTAGCPAVDAKLGAFYRRAIRGIRSADRSHVVFYEPQVLFNFGSDTSVPDLGRRLGFSFHIYCFAGLVSGAPANCPDLENFVFDNADARARKTGDSLMLSEFGATDDISILDRMTAFADRHMVSWQEWHYCGCGDPTTQGPGDTQAVVKDTSEPPRGSNVFHDKLRALARPYPQAIAGTPVRWSFDPDTKRFELVYTTKRVDAGGRFSRGLTEVFIPRVQYRHGFRARATGAATTRQGGQRLLLRAKPGAGRVELAVTPAS
ncbi:MAG: cellulase family glycosylhydrolase [Solirubrobacterales bacterium]